MSKTRTSYSASVDLRMTVDGEILSLAQVAPTYVILAKPTSLPNPTTARIDVIIDNHVTTSRQVFLFDGIKPESKKVEYF